MTRRFSIPMRIAALLIVTAAAPGFAQGGRAELAGVVLDQGRAVLPGVTVTATHEGTG